MPEKKIRGYYGIKSKTPMNGVLHTNPVFEGGKTFMKKLSCVMAFVFVISILLAGCSQGGTVGEDVSQPSQGSSQETSTTTDEGKSETSDEGNKEPVIIKWATWENIVMAKEMAEKFNERHPDIKVEIDDFGGWFGNEALSKRIASGEMPDVFAVENPFIPIQNKWILDLKPFLEEETEKKFYQNLVDTFTFDGKVVMLPAYLYVHGFIVNKSLLEANNIPIPDYNWTVDEYKDILIKTTKGQTIGTNSIVDIPKHLPAQMNDNLGWGCWDGSKYVLGEEWIQAVNLTKELHDRKVALYQIEEDFPNPSDLSEGSERDAVLEEIKNAYKERFGEEDSYNVFLKGNAATWMEFSWGLFFETNEKYSGFDWDFYPFPVMEKEDTPRPGIVCDSIAISASTKNPEAAFELVKYLSYDPQAFDDRIDVIENYDPEKAKEKYPDLGEDRIPNELTFTFIPAVNDQSIRDRWCQYNNVKPGLKYMLDLLETGYVDGFKFVPDFDTAYHKTIEKAMKDEIFTGKKTAADLAPELEKKANEITQEAIEGMRQ